MAPPKASAAAATQPDREITLGDVFDAVGSLAMRVSALSEKVDKLYTATERCATQVAALTVETRKRQAGRRGVQ